MRTAVRGAKIFNTKIGTFEKRDVVISNGHFTEDSNGYISKEIDFTGKWIIPGMVNTHEHQTYKRLYGPLFGKKGSFVGVSEAVLTLRAVRSALYALRKGVTTVSEVGAPGNVPYAMRESIDNRLIAGPRMLISGQALCITGGHANELCIEVDSPLEMRKAVRGLLKKGVDAIKLLGSSEPADVPFGEPVIAEIPTDMICAAVEEAHNVFKKVAIHAMGTVQLSRSIEAGVDIIHHGAFLNDELAEEMCRKHISYAPTLSSYRLTAHAAFNRGDKWSENHRLLWPAFDSAFAAAMRQGVSIVVGTDSLGDFVGELLMMNRRGMEPDQCIRAATINGARALGIDDRVGSIEHGKCADLVVLDGDPLVDLENLRKVFRVMKDGLLYDPLQLTIPHADPESFIETFDEGDEMQ